jgi:hypothetical protein
MYLRPDTVVVGAKKKRIYASTYPAVPTTSAETRFKFSSDKPPDFDEANTSSRNRVL